MQRTDLCKVLRASDSSTEIEKLRREVARLNGRIEKLEGAPSPLHNDAPYRIIDRNGEVDYIASAMLERHRRERRAESQFEK